MREKRGDLIYNPTVGHQEQDFRISSIKDSRFLKGCLMHNLRALSSSIPEMINILESTTLKGKKNKKKNPYIDASYMAVNEHKHQFSAPKGCQGKSLLPHPPRDRNYSNSSLLAVRQ